MQGLTSSYQGFIDQDAAYLFGGPNLTGTPERNLLMAVIERAILDYVGNEEKEASEAEEWIFEDPCEESSKTAFSFVWICNQLDLDPKKIAGTIKEMPKRGKQRTAPWYFSKVS